MTHFLYPDAIPGQPRRGRAYCGRLVSLQDHSNQPTCPTCAALVAEDESTTVEERFGAETVSGAGHE